MTIDVMAVARKAGLQVWGDKAGRQYIGEMQGEAARRFVSLILEEAAKVCDEKDGAMDTADMDWGCRECASAIRRLNP